MAHVRDLLGRRFGRLVVTERLPNNKHSRAYWKCVCDCGKSHTVSGNVLLRGLSKSCGCFRSELTTSKNWKHGKSHSRFFHTWQSMKDRCNDPTHKRYGGRGIKCEWKSFQEFYEDMWPSYEEKCREGKRFSLDRIDNDGNYSKANCRWADDYTQANNKSDNHYIEYGGRTRTLSEWSRALRVPPERIRARLKLGYTTEQALSLKRYEQRV